MKFKYTGEAPNGPIEQYGHTFAQGESVDVTDETAIAKFKAHKFFEADGEDAPAKNKGGRPKKTITAESETDGNADGA